MFNDYLKILKYRKDYFYKRYNLHRPHRPRWAPDLLKILKFKTSFKVTGL